MKIHDNYTFMFNKNAVKKLTPQNVCNGPVMKMIAPDGQHEVTILLQLHALILK